MNFQRWKYAISTGNLHLTRSCLFFSQVSSKRLFQKAKAWSFRLFNTERVRALQSSERARALQMHSVVPFYCICQNVPSGRRGTADSSQVIVAEHFK